MPPDRPPGPPSCPLGPPGRPPGPPGRPLGPLGRLGPTRASGLTALAANAKAPRGTVSISPRSARPRPRPTVVSGPSPSAGSRTARPRRAPTKVAPARSTSSSAPVTESVRTSRSVSSCRVVRSETRPARRSWNAAVAEWGAGTDGVPWAAAADAAVWAGEGTDASIPATFGACGAVMASGSPDGAYCSRASQTPMSFHLAKCLHMYTHSSGDVQHCPAGIPGVREASRTLGHGRTANRSWLESD